VEREEEEEGGATSVELRVTASFRIFSASFQCTVSTNLDTARSRSKQVNISSSEGSHLFPGKNVNNK